MSLYFITDAHLGSGADSRQREQELCSFLDSIRQEVTTLILLGDMFDFWFSYRYVVPRGHVRLLGKLAQMVDDGVEVHYFIGNHDMWLFDYLSQEIGITMHDDPEILTFDNHRFLIGHGDGLGHLDRHYDFLRRVFRCKVNQRLFALLPEWMTFGLAQRWSDYSKHSHNPDHLRYLGEDREGIVIHCKELSQSEDFDFCVFGHRHTPIATEIHLNNTHRPTCQYVNVGDWFTHRNYARYSAGRLTLHEYSTSPNATNGQGITPP